MEPARVRTKLTAQITKQLHRQHKKYNTEGTRAPYAPTRSTHHCHPMAPAVWKPKAAFTPNSNSLDTTLLTHFEIFVHRVVSMPICSWIIAITSSTLNVSQHSRSSLNARHRRSIDTRAWNLFWWRVYSDPLRLAQSRVPDVKTTLSGCTYIRRIWLSDLNWMVMWWSSMSTATVHFPGAIYRECDESGT